MQDFEILPFLVELYYLLMLTNISYFYISLKLPEFIRLVTDGVP